MKVYNFSRTKTMEHIADSHRKHDKLVFDALTALGGKIQMRVMQFRKHLAEPIRETQIKASLKRLIASQSIRMTSAPTDARGPCYEIVESEHQ